MLHLIIIYKLYIDISIQIFEVEMYIFKVEIFEKQLYLTKNEEEVIDQ